ncbi:hypothetical protein N2603_24720 [Bradyrhizobium huanghuaihaiense]|uniref:hypothetical protein n=1 Tax=Bradyrhizobium huanghuaihaiense TaxID=990078 RepID=UPI0021AAD782|nr:hypothetical protein [Bradyrhizobium sp. CB3035]UWU73301.1 hypothetical protein N2603_24720 [Bradyrhizobium sp. CB3035]
MDDRFLTPAFSGPIDDDLSQAVAAASVPAIRDSTLEFIAAGPDREAGRDRALCEHSFYDRLRGALARRVMLTRQHRPP